MKALYVSDLPPDVLKDFKVLCALKGVTIRAAVEGLLRLAVEKQKLPGSGDKG